MALELFQLRPLRLEPSRYRLLNIKNLGAIQAGGTQSTMIFFGKNFFAKNHDFSVVFHGESENQHEKIRKRFFGPQKWIFVRKY